MATQAKQRRAAGRRKKKPRLVLKAGLGVSGQPSHSANTHAPSPCGLESDRRPVLMRSTHPTGDACWRAGERGATADQRLG
jgi:hypothetical protein